jgi:ABC-type dipeptide/oligopeptide/nickel transport system ATPase component
MPRSLLALSDLHVTFSTRRGLVEAVRGVTLSLDEGEMLGLVGESGSGKSVTGFAITRLLDAAGRITAGDIRFRGQDIRRPAYRGCPFRDRQHDYLHQARQGDPCGVGRRENLQRKPKSCFPRPPARQHGRFLGQASLRRASLNGASQKARAAWGKIFARDARRRRHRPGRELVRSVSLIIPDSEKHH